VLINGQSFKLKIPVKQPELLSPNKDSEDSDDLTSNYDGISTAKKKAPYESEQTEEDKEQ